MDGIGRSSSSALRFAGFWPVSVQFSVCDTWSPLPCKSERRGGEKVRPPARLRRAHFTPLQYVPLRTDTAMVGSSSSQNDINKEKPTIILWFCCTRSKSWQVRWRCCTWFSKSSYCQMCWSQLPMRNTPSWHPPFSSFTISNKCMTNALMCISNVCILTKEARMLNASTLNVLMLE